MKKISIFSSIAVASLMSCTTFAQEMPPGAVVRTLNCALNEGVSMSEVVAWGRALPRTETSASPVFFREALHHNNNYETDYDFQIAWYHGSWTNYIADMEANRSGTPGFARAVRPGDMMTCSASDALSTYHQIPDNDGFTGDDTLMTTRFCNLQPGKSIADGYRFAAGVAANFKAAGDSSLMQVISRQVGPVQNRTGNAVVIASVPATAAAMAARQELTRNGLNPTQGLDNPFTVCNFPAMWRSYAITRPNN